MHTANHIRTVAMFSAFPFLCLVLMAIDSQFGNKTPGDTWTVFTFWCVGMIGLGTYSSLKSIHKRLSDLERRNPEGTTQV